jgi:beta-lactamase class A
MISRRTFLIASGIATFGNAILLHTSRAESNPRLNDLPTSFAQLEKSCGGRLGVAVLDTSSGQSVGYRIDERFAMCSTFKVLLAANLLECVDSGKESLDRTLTVPATGLQAYSPITQEHAGGKMSIRELCAAIITVSDNTAANLLLDTIGGPAGITHFARSLGDTVTRLDRVETALNQALPGDPRDTTSPSAMVDNLRKVLLGNTLSPSSREQLTAWLIANKTGEERLRAGLPGGWRVGDKTGSNGENTTNDIAVFWPEHRAPVLVAGYLTACPGPDAKRNGILAEVGKLIAASFRSL